MDSASDVAKRHVSRTFTWRDGHALFTPMFQDPLALRSLGPALAEPFRDLGVTAVVSQDRVLIVDDWIETGSQAMAVAEAVRQMGAEVVGTSVIVDQVPDAVAVGLRVAGILKHHELPEG